MTGHVRAKNGSNSNWLREIGAGAKIPAFLIVDKTEFDLDVLRGAKNIGLTAGASAPEIPVEDVEDGIEASSARGPVEVTILPGVAENGEFKLPAGLNDPRAA